MATKGRNAIQSIQVEHGTAQRGPRARVLRKRWDRPREYWTLTRATRTRLERVVETADQRAGASVICMVNADELWLAVVL